MIIKIQNLLNAEFNSGCDSYLTLNCFISLQSAKEVDGHYKSAHESRFRRNGRFGEELESVPAKMGEGTNTLCN